MNPYVLDKNKSLIQSNMFLTNLHNTKSINLDFAPTYLQTKCDNLIILQISLNQKQDFRRLWHAYTFFDKYL